MLNRPTPRRLRRSYRATSYFVTQHSVNSYFGSTQAISGWPSRSLGQTPAIAALPPEWAPGQEAKEATVPAVTATLAPDVRVTVRKELLRRVDFALSSKKTKIN